MGRLSELVQIRCQRTILLPLNLYTAMEVASISPDFICLSVSETARQCYQYCFIPGTVASDPNNPSLFADIDPHSHAIRRRAVRLYRVVSTWETIKRSFQVAKVYSMSSMTRLETCIEPVIKLLLDVFDTNIVSSSAIVDLSRWLHFFASDAVGELAVRSVHPGSRLLFNNI